MASGAGEVRQTVGLSHAAEGIAAIVRDTLEVGEARCAIVLGSGLAGLVSRMEGVRTVPFGELEGLPEATVAGHRGAFIAGMLGGREVVALSGRIHLYEGHSAAVATLPIRIMQALGAPILLLSNAAGGIRRSLGLGELMVIADHLDFQWRKGVALSAKRLQGSAVVYDDDLRRRLLASAVATGARASEGVYAAVLGPSFETPAEIRMLERLGADAVGMSTAPEARLGHALGMRVAAMSCVTNKAAGISGEKLSHAEVLHAGMAAAEMFSAVVEEFVRGL